MKFNHNLFVSAMLFGLVVSVLILIILMASVIVTNSVNLGLMLIILTFLLAVVIASIKGLEPCNF